MDNLYSLHHKQQLKILLNRDKKPTRDPYLIVKDGQLAGMGAHSYTKGTATGGSEEAAKYKK